MRRCRELLLFIAPLAAAQPMEWPVAGEVSSEIGSRESVGGGEDAVFHKGIDISVPVGTPVRPVARGVVAEHWPPPGDRFRGHPVFGGYIIIYHGRGVYSAYAHLSATYVQSGQWVDREDIIALSGNTGLSTGPHLHFELFLDATWFIEGPDVLDVISDITGLE